MFDLKWYRKLVYGQETSYLVAHEQARERAAICQLTGRKSLTVSDREALEALGFTFTEVSAFNLEDK